MASQQVKQQAQKIVESCNKLQNMETDEAIRNELSKIKQYCSVIENQI
ncbi:hypothetical protein [Paenibacillus ginsengarvi]|nr:hypothetical protein [Paenibacillus ginsengarvi]